MRSKRLMLLVGVAVLALFVGVMPATAEEIRGELSYDEESNTLSVGEDTLELPEGTAESRSFGDLDGDDEREALLDELIGLDGETVTLTFEDGVLTGVTVNAGDAEGGADQGLVFEETTDTPSSDQLPDEASDTARAVLDVISGRDEFESGCEFGHAVAEAASGEAPEGECPDDENEPENEVTGSSNGDDKGAEGRARGQEKAEAGKQGGQSKAEAGKQGGQADNEGDGEDAGPPENIGPPEDPGAQGGEAEADGEDAGPPEGAGPPANTGPPNG